MLRDNLCLVLKEDGRFFVDKRNHKKKKKTKKKEEEERKR